MEMNHEHLELLVTRVMPSANTRPVDCRSARAVSQLVCAQGLSAPARLACCWR